MKYLKIFDNKTQHENAVLNGTLYSPSISFIINDGENTELVFKIIKVKNCIELGYFGVDSKNIKPIAELPHAVTLISDFADVFFADKDLDGNKLSQPYIFLYMTPQFLSSSRTYKALYPLYYIRNYSIQNFRCYSLYHNDCCHKIGIQLEELSLNRKDRHHTSVGSYMCHRYMAYLPCTIF